MKIAVGHRKFRTELKKQPISYVDKFSKMSDNKKKKIVEFIWIITHNSQHKALLNVSIINGKYKDESRLISKETRMPFKLFPEKNHIFSKFSD